MSLKGYHKLFVHLVWSTDERQPLIDAHEETVLYEALIAKSKALQCVPIAIGGMADHVHMLLAIKPSLAVSTLVQKLKGMSSRLMSSEISPGKAFRWQEGYGAFTVGPPEVAAVAHYVQNQKRHHNEGRLVDRWENW